MAQATVNVSETNGTIAGAVTTDGVATMNFGSADTPDLTPSAHKIVRGTYSYTKWWRLHVAAMNDATGISNVQLWKASGVYKTQELIGATLAGAAGLGLAFWIIPAYGKRAPVSGSGADVSPMPNNSSGTQICGGNTWGNGNMTVPTADPGAENVAIGGAGGGSLAAPGYSNYVAFATSTTTSTEIGAVNQKVFTWQYDEI